MEKTPSSSGPGPDREPYGASGGNVRLLCHSTELFRHHIPTEFILLGLIESMALVLSFYAGIKLRLSTMTWIEIVSAHTFNAMVFAVAMLSCLIAFGAYQRQSHHSFWELAIRIGSSLLAGLLFLSLTYYVAPMFFLGRGALALAVLASFVSIMAVRLGYSHFMSTNDLRLRVLVLGNGKTAGLIRNAREAGELDGLNLVDFMPMPGDVSDEKGISLVNTPGALPKYVAEQQIDVIVLAMDERRHSAPVHELLDCKMGGVEVIDLLTFFERHTSKIRLDIIQPSWIFLSDGFRVSSFRRLRKRMFDVGAVLLLSPFVLPLCALATLALLVESRGRGPVFYTQTRVGEYGRPFQIYKFRSMVTDAERDGVARWAQKRDTRITRVGGILRKFRIDEIPQLYNVLRGDMSFVGPRPERPEFVERLVNKIPYYGERHRVKPGLSGWAQIRYPYGASEEDGLEKLQYDLYYVKNYSTLLDTLILLQTAEVVLLGRGAH